MIKKTFTDLEDADDFSKVKNDFSTSLSKHTVSKDGTSVPPAPHIVDDTGSVWALSWQEDHGGHIVVRDGKRVPGTGVMLIWHTDRVCLKNAPGAWFVWDGANQRWGQTSDPTQSLST